jgi:hypothetical protein
MEIATPASPDRSKAKQKTRARDDNSIKQEIFTI